MHSYPTQTKVSLNFIGAKVQECQLGKLSANYYIGPSRSLSYAKAKAPHLKPHIIQELCLPKNLKTDD